MYTDIVINATPYENRIAVVERGNLLEFHLERPTENGLVGNIYQGKVVRVLPGMQAAFVDIGLDRTGFLYVDDIDISMSMAQLLQPEVSPSIIDAVEKNAATHLAIEDLLKEGQTILVQIAKEPIGSKGARLNCHITLPCRNLVFMPLTDHIGISRKIEDEDIREELRQKIEQLRPEGTGFIVRTVAENVTAAEIEADMEFLMLLWDDIRSNAQRATAPCLIYQDLDDLIDAVRKGNKELSEFDCSCFNGEYVTNDVDGDYFKKLQVKRNDAAKNDTGERTSSETVEL